MGIIRISDLQLRGLLGTHPWERKNKQDITVNIVLEYDSHKASQTDKINDAVDYEKLVKQVTAIVERSKYHLIEKLAKKIMDFILADKKVLSASVRIDKPQAIGQARSVSFELFGRQE